MPCDCIISGYVVASIESSMPGFVRSLAANWDGKCSTISIRRLGGFSPTGRKMRKWN